MLTHAVRHAGRVIMPRGDIRLVPLFPGCVSSWSSMQQPVPCRPATCAKNAAGKVWGLTDVNYARPIYSMHRGKPAVAGEAEGELTEAARMAGTAKPELPSPALPVPHCGPSSASASRMARLTRFSRTPQALQRFFSLSILLARHNGVSDVPQNMQVCNTYPVVILMPYRKYPFSNDCHPGSTLSASQSYYIEIGSADR